MISREEIKLYAKDSMRAARPSTIFVTIVYLMMASVTVIYVGSLDIRAAIDNGIFTQLFTIRGLILSVAFLALELFLGVLGGGYSAYCLHVSRDEQAGFGTLFECFNYFLKFLGLQIVMALLVLVGTIFFVIPGIIMAYSFSQAVRLLIDDPSRGIMECLKESRNIMRGHRFELFILEISFWGWLMLAPFTFGLLTFWLTPYMETTNANFYNELVGHVNPNGAPPPNLHNM